MAFSLDDLRPSTARRIAFVMFILFLAMGIESIAFGVYYWRYQFEAADGIPFVMKLTQLIVSCVGTPVAFFIAFRFGRYARKLGVKHRNSA